MERTGTAVEDRRLRRTAGVAISGCTGNLPSVENSDIQYAQSAILTPSDVGFAKGGVGAECNPNIETVVMDDVDLELLRRHRQSGSVQN